MRFYLSWNHVILLFVAALTFVMGLLVFLFATQVVSIKNIEKSILIFPSSARRNLLGLSGHCHSMLRWIFRRCRISAARIHQVYDSS